MKDIGTLAGREANRLIDEYDAKDTIEPGSTYGLAFEQAKNLNSKEFGP